MRSAMTPAQLAKLKSKTRSANELDALATAANGHEVTSAERRSAEAALVERVGQRKAAKLKEDALVRAGARPRGIRRILGI